MFKNKKKKYGNGPKIGRNPPPLWKIPDFFIIFLLNPSLSPCCIASFAKCLGPYRLLFIKVHLYFPTPALLWVLSDLVCVTFEGKCRVFPELELCLIWIPPSPSIRASHFQSQSLVSVQSKLWAWGDISWSWWGETQVPWAENSPLFRDSDICFRLRTASANLKQGLMLSQYCRNEIETSPN